MNRGDHLVSPRTGYQHHGLYLGQQQVIHYAGPEGDLPGQVLIGSLEEFAHDNPVWVKTHPLRTYNDEECVARAYRRLGETHYNLLFNNCEHFVTWCIQGFAYSQQIEALINTRALAKQALSYSLVANPKSITSQPLLPSSQELAAIGTGTLVGTLATHTTVATGLLAATACPPAVLGAVGAYGIKKLFDWLTD
ncbi:lecithin retinol acyltransferase family protein [Aeromonas simiae]|uniref:lecithin retinol acyltransferase family protein n=1 Tax=Aeromonas simiae TaxID=218936 RepID=UPI00266BA85B|nr:lecithin retinol acyltransferase family protein [Aeromonas simiae]MDO2949068.1 lecithin retinol acyltransferase family protein [Aeromonas simiae]MDO2956337.1 lecithin retinol acyltransferase family protein [Aeromonas simiae]